MGDTVASELVQGNIHPRAPPWHLLTWTTSAATTGRLLPGRKCTHSPKNP
uniref:Uncharacterized protein n=1 Tax=Anguilla anguilla TaxID=7936 RepID=A0A0E9TCL3_ANGAN